MYRLQGSGGRFQARPTRGCLPRPREPHTDPAGGCPASPLLLLETRLLGSQEPRFRAGLPPFLPLAFCSVVPRALMTASVGGPTAPSPLSD